MNFHPYLALLQPYPFEKLRQLFAETTPDSGYKAISLGIGEPKHATPEFIKTTITDNLSGLASYPATAGSDALRHAIGDWLTRRYGLQKLAPLKQILPVNGSREALFSLAQTVINPQACSSGKPLVLCPNPFYQIYEGAALLSGAEPYFANSDPARNFGPDFDSIPDEVWQRVQLAYICSPGNPTGAVLNLEDWRKLFELSDRYGFVIAADECYSEIYFQAEPPLGGLQAAQALGRDDFRRMIMLSSLSKRSNVPGMRSGFVAGDAEIIQKFLLYRTYHGSAMCPSFQQASVAAWNDEQHVIDNRLQYQQKFAQITPLLAEVLEVKLPDAAFYLWAKIPEHYGLSDTEFARLLYQRYHVTVLPGSFLAREAHGINPGANRIRMALVAEVAECMEAAQRIVAFCKELQQHQV